MNSLTSAFNSGSACTSAAILCKIAIRSFFVRPRGIGLSKNDFFAMPPMRGARYLSVSARVFRP